MAIDKRQFKKGIKLRPDDDALSDKGEVKFGDTADKLQYQDGSATRNVVSEDGVQTLENKTMDFTAATGNNTISADSDDVAYDNASSTLVATDVKAALDEVDTRLLAQDEADEITYDNSTSGMAATEVQSAIDEVEARVDTIESVTYVNSFNSRTGVVVPAASDYDSDQIDYDNATSGMAATDAQGAIDELDGRLDSVEGATYVNSFNSRTGAVVPAASDYDADQVDYDNATSGLAATEVQAALDEIDGNLDTHIADTTTHGTTGDIVGTSDSQTLTNKTINSSDIDLGTASDTNKLVVSKDTTANLEALTRESGSIYYSTDDEGYLGDDGSDLISLGGGSGGGLDTFLNENFERTKSSDLSSGNSAIFGASGTLDGVLSDNELTPISDERSIKYVMGSSSTNDWFHVESVTIDPKQQGKNCKVTFYAKYNGDADDVSLKLWDETNDTILGEMPINDSLLRRYELGFTPSSTTTELKVGFQVDVGNNTKILEFDDIELSVLPQGNFVVNETGKSEIKTSGANGFGSTSTKIRRFDSIDYVEGDDLVVTNTAADGCEIEVKSEGIYYINYSDAPSPNPELLANGGFSTGDLTNWNIIAGTASVNSANQLVVDDTAGNVHSDTFSTVVGKTYVLEYEIIDSGSGNNAGLVGALNGSGSTITTWNTQAVGIYSRTFVAGETTAKIRLSLGVTGTGDPIYDNISVKVAEPSLMGLSLNADVTSNLDELTEDEILSSEGLSNSCTTNWIGHLSVGDIIRPHTNGLSEEVDNITSIVMGKVKPLGGDRRVLYLKDIKSNGSDGGGFTSGLWQTRDINTIEGNQSFLSSLSSNQFVLKAGTYKIRATAPGYAVDRHKIRLQNITDSTTPIEGTSETAQDGIATSTRSVLSGEITISSDKTFEIQHQCSTSRAGNGLGLGSSFSVDEFFTEIEIEDINTGGASGASSSTVILQDVQTTGTDGAALTAGLSDRSLNNQIGSASWISNVSGAGWDLAEGSYIIDAEVCGHRVEEHQSKILNITDSTDSLGSSEVSPSNLNSELLLNNNWSSGDLTSWTDASVAPSGAVSVNGSNQLEITSPTGGLGSAEQIFSGLTIGKTYTVRVDIESIDAGMTAQALVQTIILSSYTTPGIKEFDFVATATSHKFILSEPGTGTGVITINSASIKVAYSGGLTTTKSRILDTFTISSSKSFKLQQYVKVDSSSGGGHDSGSGFDNVYAQVKITKV